MICLDAEAVGPWVCERAGGAWVPGRGTAIGWVNKGKLVAGVIFEDFNGANILAHMAGEGNFLKRQFLHFIFWYPFKQLQAKRVTLPIASTNEKAIRFVEHLGFEHEATLRDAHPSGDLVLYKMTSDQCRWI